MSTAPENELTGYPREISRFLTELTTAQKNLIALHPAKKAALIARDFNQVTELQRQERLLQQKLTQVLSLREHLLHNLQRTGSTGATLHQVCQIQGWLALKPLMDQFLEARSLGLELRQQSWSLWTFAHRASRYYSTALELIAQRGMKQATYNQDPNTQYDAGGGSLFDASI
ncbi:hypothetical protein [Rubinisphaera italica]|uniref:FlgN protein n=1 Tax=Rubinisphaera italica TaxID=2527969 RepID=A0A5C5XCD2_9PLAN|nr:hypothetical protein [Rubinisphaera italica]TWT59953.1 FlgN protein [Rubinisphaera italica]